MPRSKGSKRKRKPKSYRRSKRAKAMGDRFRKHGELTDHELEMEIEALENEEQASWRSWAFGPSHRLSSMKDELTERKREEKEYLRQHNNAAVENLEQQRQRRADEYDRLTREKQQEIQNIKQKKRDKSLAAERDRINKQRKRDESHRKKRSSSQPKKKYSMPKASDWMPPPPQGSGPGSGSGSHGHVHPEVVKAALAAMTAMSGKDVSTLTGEEIKSLYKKLALKLHPDKGGDTEAFKILSGAFETLQTHNIAAQSKKTKKKKKKGSKKRRH